MKRNWIPLLFLAGALATPVAVSGTAAVGPEPAEVMKLKLGSTVPESLTLKDFEGESLSFEDLRGKVVILHFWSDRCPAERHANPVFMRMEKRYAGSKDVVMVGIASNQNELGSEPGDGADYSDHYVSLRKQRDKDGTVERIAVKSGQSIPRNR